jgi:hypothetical protein
MFKQKEKSPLSCSCIIGIKDMAAIDAVHILNVPVPIFELYTMGQLPAKRPLEGR